MAALLSRLLSFLKKRLSRHKRRLGPTPILSLPVELVLEIAAFLPPPSQLRLALSCISFLAIIDSSGALQRSSQFRPPIDFFCQWRTPKRIFDAFPSEWWRLLRHLENSQWRCCSTCLKLHPVSKFSAKDLARSAEERTCMFGPFAGIVHLCPCISMTFRDKRKLIDKLRGEEFAATEQPKDLLDTRPCVNGDVSNSATSWHYCLHTYEHGVAVRTRINPILQEDGDLLIRTEYSMTGNCHQVDLLRLPRVCCPHRSIYTHIMDMSDIVSHGWRQGRDIRPDLARPVHCKWCQTSISDFEKKMDQRTFRSCSFRVQRRLGKAYEKADRRWYEQGHFSLESTSHSV